MAWFYVSRQRLRKGIIFSLFLFFPLLYNFFSPYIIIDGASQGIVNGSLIAFSLMFFSSLFVGRLWCGWFCPAGGLQEASFMIQEKKANNRMNWIKWLIWIPWFGLVITLFIKAGGVQNVNPLHSIDLGSTMLPFDTLRYYIIYYFVVGLILIPSLAAGKRAFCHAVCWMAPFMILGRKFRNLARWPALGLKADSSRCTDCKTCTRSCPMSLDVNAMVRAGSMEHSECILCGTCIDGCTKNTIRYHFGR